MEDFYIYLHIHPLMKIPFYVEKGKSERAWDIHNRSTHHKSYLKRLLSGEFLMNDIVEIVKTNLSQKKPHLKNTKWWTNGVQNKQSNSSPRREWRKGFTNKRYKEKNND